MSGPLAISAIEIVWCLPDWSSQGMPSSSKPGSLRPRKLQGDRGYRQPPQTLPSICANQRPAALARQSGVPTPVSVPQHRRSKAPMTLRDQETTCLYSRSRGSWMKTEVVSDGLLADGSSFCARAQDGATVIGERQPRYTRAVRFHDQAPIRSVSVLYRHIGFRWRFDFGWRHCDRRWFALCLFAKQKLLNRRACRGQ
jgi:hypothetical protein